MGHGQQPQPHELGLNAVRDKRHQLRSTEQVQAAQRRPVPAAEEAIDREASAWGEVMGEGDERVHVDREPGTGRRQETRGGIPRPTQAEAGPLRAGDTSPIERRIWIDSSLIER